MTANKLSRTCERGVAIGGLAFLLLGSAIADETLGERVQREFQDRSFVLIESPSSPPRLLLLAADPQTRREVTPAPGADTNVMNEAVGRALLRLADADPAVREDAILELADAGGGADLIAIALSDPSRDVRDTAETVLEDLSDAARN